MGDETYNDHNQNGCENATVVNMPSIVHRPLQTGHETLPDTLGDKAGPCRKFRVEIAWLRPQLFDHAALPLGPQPKADAAACSTACLQVRYCSANTTCCFVSPSCASCSVAVF